MKIGKGVEWVAHTCALLALLPPRSALPGDALANFIGVAPPYLAKQLQALSRAGIVSTKRGAKGGYRLAKAPDEISLWDITASVEGTAPSFRCTEIRRDGPCGASASECKNPCSIAAAFRDAEAQYRDALAAIPLTELVAGIAKAANSERKQNILKWIAQHATEPA